MTTKEPLCKELWNMPRPADDASVAVICPEHKAVVCWFCGEYEHIKVRRCAEDPSQVEIAGIETEPLLRFFVDVHQSCRGTR